MIPWHPHTQSPAERGVTAIIGIRVGYQVEPAKGWMIVPGTYFWRAEHGKWINEQSGQRLMYPEYWYCLENDLLGHLSARAHLAENGHG